jgi:hypothetical protein
MGALIAETTDHRSAGKILFALLGFEFRESPHSP